MICCIPTPDSILEDDEIDVFEEIFPDTETYYDIMRSAMWARYGFRGIGNPDLTYWLKTMKARYDQIKTVYEIKFKAFEEWLQTVGGNAPVDLSDSSTEYTMRTENEDTPDNPQGSKVYLSDRNTVSYNGKSYGGLSSETVSRFMDSVSNLEEQFCDEFRRNFYHGV